MYRGTIYSLTIHCQIVMIISLRPYIDDAHMKGSRWGLEICHVFIDSNVFKIEVLLIFMDREGLVVGFKKFFIFNERHRCMTPCWNNPLIKGTDKIFETLNICVASICKFLTCI